MWLVGVMAAGLGGRVLDQWESAVTMVFGSFLAGSSPLGGGAVAFPVFTKALAVPAAVARTFGLVIQAVGMTMASISIVAARRPIHRQAAIVGSIAAIAGFAASVALFSRRGEVFWPSAIPTSWVKATFSIVLAATALLMVRHRRHRSELGSEVTGGSTPVRPGWRYHAVLVLMALAGGMLSNLTGTGANIAVFLFLVVLAGTAPKVALPTAVVVMSAVSVVGFVLYGLIDGQLTVDVVGERVVEIGGTPVDLAASEADLLALFLAAVPVVIWGAPLGSLAAAVVPERVLVRFIAAMASVEVVTTFVLVPELRTDPALIAYLAAGLVLAPLGLIWGQRHRSTLFGWDEELAQGD
jgi:uncharacterized membrane protein YfcA